MYDLYSIEDDLSSDIILKFDQYIQHCIDNAIIPEAFDFGRKFFGEEYLPYYCDKYLEYCKNLQKVPSDEEYWGFDSKILDELYKKINILVWNFIITNNKFINTIYKNLDDFQKRIYLTIIERYKTFLYHKIETELLEYDYGYYKYIEYCEEQHKCPSEEEYFGEPMISNKVLVDFDLSISLHEFISNNHMWMVLIYKKDLSKDKKDLCIKLWQENSSWDNLSDSYLKNIDFYNEIFNKTPNNAIFIDYGYNESDDNAEENYNDEYDDEIDDVTDDKFDYYECYKLGQNAGYNDGYETGYNVSHNVTQKEEILDNDTVNTFDPLSGNSDEDIPDYVIKSDAYQEGYTDGFEMGFQDAKYEANK